MQVIVRVKRKAENGADNGAVQPEAKRQENGGAAEEPAEDSGGGLGGLVGYGTDSDSQ